MPSKRNHYKDTGFARGKMTMMYYFPPGMADAMINAAKRELAKGVIRVVADAKSRCPVDTGELRRSIKAESNDDESMFYISANAYRRTKNPQSLTGKFYYGAVVEFSPKINKPFLYPALLAHENEIRQNIRNAVLRVSGSRFRISGNYGLGQAA